MSHSVNDKNDNKKVKHKVKKDTLLWEVLCPTKTKPTKKKEGGKIKKRLSFCADVSLADEPRWQWLEAAKLKWGGGGVFIGQIHTSQHH